MPFKDKSEELKKAIDSVSKALFGNETGNSIKQEICVICSQEATEFNDALSRKEYKISGMCQECQDDFFGG